MAKEVAQCQLCRRQAQREPSEEAALDKYECATCGKYRISAKAVETLTSDNGVPIHLIAGYVRERHESGVEARITEEELDRIPSVSDTPRTVPEQLDRLLQQLARRQAHLKNRIPREHIVYPLAYVGDDRELEAALGFLIERGYIEPGGRGYQLKLEGWDRFAQLEASKPSGTKCFVAMNFDPELDPVYENAISPAIKAAGFDPRRVDREEHNEDIVGFMLSEIAQSRLLVADVTGQKHGVYFEAGYAMGLGRPVIWSCKKCDFKNLHFDTEHYNHIVWEADPELCEKLEWRIKETIIPGRL